MHLRRTFLATFAAIAFTLSVSDGFAQLASKPADEWSKTLARPERVASLKIDEIVSRLGLKPGSVVADIGAGPGVFEPALSKAVTPGGKVYAVEIDQGFIDKINKRAADEQLKNVVAVLGEFTDPKLPAKDVDVAMFNDVLHHVEKRGELLQSLAGYLKPNGRIAVIELDPVTGSHKDDPTLQVSKETLKVWMEAAGLHQVEEVTGLFDDGKWFVIYQKGKPAGTR